MSIVECDGPCRTQLIGVFEALTVVGTAWGETIAPPSTSQSAPLEGSSIYCNQYICNLIIKIIIMISTAA